jgi:uncharacterized SAM-binding protein YcdF (DUF218 family)
VLTATKRALRAAGVLIASVTAVYLGVITIEIQRVSTMDEARPADVIIVLGAAEYRGRPSPVLRARLDHAYELFAKGLAPRILTTGGSGPDPSFTEGEVGRGYLVRLGVPSEAIIVEPEGESTFHSLVAASEIMQRMNLRSCIVVSDGYHIFRVKKMLQFEGLTVYGSPRLSGPGNPVVEWWQYFRQAVAYLMWNVGITL